MKYLFSTILLILFCLACDTQPAQQSEEINYNSSSLSQYDIERNQFVDSLLNEMTLLEKLGQMNLPTSGDITTGTSKSSNVAEDIRAGKVGGLFNIKGVDKIRDVQRIAVEESRLGIPLIFAMDVIHGYESTFPIPLGLSASWNMDLIQQTARVAAIEASADGINWTFSPMTDVSKDPRWGRISEGAGEDPYLQSQIAKAMVKGYQGNDLSAHNTLLACVKHFALYGASEAGRDYNTVDMSNIRMFNEYLPPYKAAVDAGVGTVMASFNEVHGVPATGNKWLMDDVLRKKWGFDGFIVTDYTGIMEMIAHGVGEDMDAVSKLALNAGMDMDMVSEGFLNLDEEAANGEVEVAKIDNAVRRILAAKYDLGLFEDPYKYCNSERAKELVYNNENRNFARQVATESMVLLKNENNVLPLKKSGTIALIGPLANTPENMAGTWSVATQQSKSITLLQGLQDAVGNNATILHAKGSNVDYDLQYEERVSKFGKTIPRTEQTDDELRAEAIRIANESDVIVAAIGETAELSGEASSVSNLQIPQAQKDLLNALLATGKPVVLTLFTGRPLAITQENETVPAILNVWFSGSEAGYAIADVLFGDVNPSGKITATFPRNVGQVPIYYSYKNTGRPLTDQQIEDCEFQKFKSAYLDVCNTPLYPFGYGLSYTNFSYSDVNLSSDNLSQNGEITASVTISNTGNYDGKEVVQLYIRDMIGSITRPVKELKGFQKVMIPKGESTTVSFNITEEDLRFYNANIDFVSEPGKFEVFIGPHSATKNKASFTLTE